MHRPPALIITAALAGVLATAWLLPASVSAAIIINELQSDNEQTVADDHGEFDDWIELLNTGSVTVDLTGYRISDDLDLADPYILPGPLTMAPGARLLLWADGQIGQGAAHLPFRLSSSGEAVSLITPDGLSIVDQLEYPRQFTDHVYQRYPDASAGWTWGRDPSPMAANLEPNHGGFLVLNELMPINSTVITDDAEEYEPWLEIHNPLLVPVDVSGMLLGAVAGDEFALPSLVLEPQAYVLVWLDGQPEQGVWHGPDLLSSSGGALLLAAADGVTASDVLYPALAADVALARMPDGGVWQSTVLVTPGQTNPATASPLLVINEFLASNDTGITDEAGDHEDWVELYNPGDAAVSLAGMFLTDDLSAPDAWPLPFLSLEAGDYLIIWCDNDPEEGALHTNFKLSASGEELALYLGDELVDSIVFGSQTTDVSTGRRVDAGLPWITFDEPTPGAANHPAVAAPVPGPTATLLPPRPNPFNPRVELAWRAPAAGEVSLEILDLQGCRVAVLHQGWLPAGTQRVIWDGRDARGRNVPSGTYAVLLRQGGESSARTITLVR